jgi:hypothetical protein
MRTMALALLVGCAGVREGVQIGDENIAQDPPCDVTERVVAVDEPALDGASAADLLATLPLAGTAAPSWTDGGDATIEVDLAWDGGEITLVESLPARAGETCAGRSLRLGVEGTVASSDGLVDEVVAAEIGLWADGGGSVDVAIPAAEVGGSLDVDALVDPLIDGDFTATLEVLVHLSPGEAVHGALVALGCEVVPAGEAGADEACSPVEHDVAVW